ncbi:MAG: hypothetical protein KDH96_01085 [Candidatus Riesia sp.]|nr:hypothetical protein [Candidatus Riesia sp.]
MDLLKIPTLNNPPYTLSDDGLQASNDYMSKLMFEHINRGGAPIKLFKLLGLKERETGILQEYVYISSKSLPCYEPVFLRGNTVNFYKSKETGINITTDCYIGIDCGYIKLKNGRKYYSNDASYQIHVRSFTLQQSEFSQNRITKCKVERSDDGVNWKGVQIVSLINDNLSHVYYIKESCLSRYWRIKPILFNGNNNDHWIVKKLLFSTHSNTAITDVNIDHGILENRKRSYSTDPIQLKVVYTPSNVDTMFTGFGLFNMNKQEMTIHFESTVELLNRPIVIGDIIELPFEGQFDTEMRLSKKLMEVVDVSWSTEGYTPGYKPLLQTVVMEPVTSSEENKDVVTKLKDAVGSQLFSNVTEYLNVANTSTITDSINNESKEKVPQKGINNQEIDKSLVNQNHYLYGDALPPNGESYTEGYVLPDAKNATDGEYFRLLYKDLDIPARLYKFSCTKKRWLFMEEDSRTQQDVVKKPTNDTLLKGNSPR